MKYDRVYQELMTNLLYEQQLGYTALMPGGFKPPHKGHFELAKAYAEDSAVKCLKIMLGPTTRTSSDKSIVVDNQMSKNIWKIYMDHLPPGKVDLIEVKNPYTAAYEYVQDDAEEGDTVVFVASIKDPSDAQRSEKFAADHSEESGKYHRPGVNVLHYPKDTVAVYEDRGDMNNGEPISATIMRDDAANHDVDMLKTSLPDEVHGSANKILRVMTSNL